MDKDTNTATVQATGEPTMADLQAQIADLQNKLSQPIKTTTANDAFSTGFKIWLVMFPICFLLVSIIALPLLFD